MLITHLSIGKRLKTSTFEHREWLIEMAKVQLSWTLANGVAREHKVNQW